MHLLNIQPGAIDDGGEAVDIGQSPADIVFLSAADTELATLAAAHRGLGTDKPTLRLANLLHLRHPMSVDLYVEQTAAQARIVVVRLLGGRSYWPYGVEQLIAAANSSGCQLALLPGDDKPDEDLKLASTLARYAYDQLWDYFVQGGQTNARRALEFAFSLYGESVAPPEAVPLLAAGLYWPDLATPSLADLQSRWRAGCPLAAITFYRALAQSGQTETIDALIAALDGAGMNALPIYAQSFKDPRGAKIVRHLLSQTPPDTVINLTGFALATPGGVHQPTLLDTPGGVVVQAVMAGLSEEAWSASPRGLGVRDIAMNVALPEIDGRVHGRAIAFKSEIRFDDLTETPIIVHRPRADRVEFVARLAHNWAQLRALAPGDKRVALILANYPNRDGRIGNGVGLDTPASTVAILAALTDGGYNTRGNPESGAALMALLLAGRTNALGGDGFATGETIPLSDYALFFSKLPDSVQQLILDRWGAPEVDPFVSDGVFCLPLHRFGNTAIGIQPARGYNIDPKSSYHDPDLVPPHGYLAFYAWIRQSFDAHAMVQIGKHGNLEWLPGKGLALSGDCFPEVALGPLPLIYPFIVNDPGEGAQAKRRAAAVVVDHLTPPLTRAETYGPLKDLEALVDEYFEAAQGDPRRTKRLSAEILAHARATGLDADCGIDANTGEADALTRLDAHLCDLKEMQIRDGLHIFGRAPQGGTLDRLLVALARVPRGSGENGDASLIGALADDLDLGFDPLAANMAETWSGEKPQALHAVTADLWRTAGDTIERLEILAERLIAGTSLPDPNWPKTRLVLSEVETRFRPQILASGEAEIAGALKALNGCFVAPGPSGAPTRGRPDVLPTGRNFYSIDSRAVPTPTAWALGQRSASLLVDEHRQRHGEWPRHMALSAWGTANMRTGGDDIAQGLALMGAKPLWEAASRRVTGFEILPLAALGRPRVDVTLRVSGFFRDAFPAQMDLFDSACRAIAALDEDAMDNPIAARVAEDTAHLIADGLDADEASHRAGYRVFSSKPGAYGAGLQALIDENIWATRTDFGEAYVAWSAYAYGKGSEGAPEPGLFRKRLGHIDAVVHNQDNREHDLLDSDDYYQFEGGLSAAVEAACGTRPEIYHNDHSRPETPKIRTLEEEIARVVRARAVNPKWIEGVMRHGYKGASEIAATVDYLFAFQATTGAVAHHHFDLLFDAYLGDDRVRAFIGSENPPALTEIAARFAEALARDLWRPRSNRVYDLLRKIETAGVGKVTV